jgi:hypothetical protein
MPQSIYASFSHVLLASGVMWAGRRIATFASTVSAQDWPQIMGPDRSGQASGAGRIWRAPWPKAATKINLAGRGWGAGMRARLSVGQQVLVLHRLGQTRNAGSVRSGNSGKQSVASGMACQLTAARSTPTVDRAASPPWLPGNGRPARAPSPSAMARRVIWLPSI